MTEEIIQYTPPLNCPFCGGTAQNYDRYGEVSVNDKTSIMSRCNDCQASADDITWNWRTTDKSNEEVKKLREEKLKNWKENQDPIKPLENPCLEIEMPDPKMACGNEIFDRIQQIGREKFRHALDVGERLRKDEFISDGELLDAMFTFNSHLDLANPMMPVLCEIFERFMMKCDIEKTPNGIEKDWYRENEDYEWLNNIEE